MIVNLKYIVILLGIIFIIYLLFLAKDHFVTDTNVDTSIPITNNNIGQLNVGLNENLASPYLVDSILANFIMPSTNGQLVNTKKSFAINIKGIEGEAQKIVDNKYSLYIFNSSDSDKIISITYGKRIYKTFTLVSDQNTLNNTALKAITCSLLIIDKNNNYTITRTNLAAVPNGAKLISYK